MKKLDARSLVWQRGRKPLLASTEVSCCTRLISAEVGLRRHRPQGEVEPLHQVNLFRPET